MATLSGGVYALFDGETMVVWPMGAKNRWPYPLTKAEPEVLRSPSYDMDKKHAELEKEIIQQQDGVGDDVGIWTEATMSVAIATAARPFSVKRRAWPYHGKPHVVSLSGLKTKRQTPPIWR